ncbi:MAG: Na/Pi symporter [Phycisphaerales bacterium]
MVTTLGGIGLFLLGMLFLTEGIKLFAGTALRELLKRYIRGPLSGMAVGTGITAILQSSSATMLTVIGFVSAGLITFPQALGVIFGANLGTTSTGWIVSMLGFKLSIGAGALPMIFIGALLRLLTSGRWSALGTAVAGFGLLFFGIGMMQEGMGGLSAHIDLARFAGEGVPAILILVVVGIVMTIIMQSSSAAMAITLAALHTGGIDIAQGAALVIGQNVGTTVTAAIAAIGGTNAARRTAVAHIAFNILTGLIALALLPVFVWGVGEWEASSGHIAGVGVLAGFHTGFNVVGIAVFLPMVGRFSRLIERLVPEHRSSFERHLDPSVAGLGKVGMETARRTLLDVLGAFVSNGVFVLRDQPCPGQLRQEYKDGLEVLPMAGDFIAKVGTASGAGEELGEQVDLMHALDHLNELSEVLDKIDHQQITADTRGLIEAMRSRAEAEFVRFGEAIKADGLDAESITATLEEVAELRRSIRRDLIQRLARGEIGADVGAELIDRVRWMDTSVYHMGRAMRYLETNRAG